MRYTKYFSSVLKNQAISNLNVEQYSRFFVEVVYDTEHNTITEVRSFKSGVHVDKYTSHIVLK
jgi:hypothetical protein